MIIGNKQMESMKERKKHVVCLHKNDAQAEFRRFACERISRRYTIEFECCLVFLFVFFLVLFETISLVECKIFVVFFVFGLFVYNKVHLLQFLPFRDLTLFLLLSCCFDSPTISFLNILFLFHRFNKRATRNSNFY